VSSNEWKPTVKGMELYEISPERLGFERHFRYHPQLLLIEQVRARAKQNNCNPELLEYLNRVQKSIEVERDGDLQLLTQIRRAFTEDDRLFWYEEKRGSHIEEGYLILGSDGKERRRWVAGESQR
jgi:hypothetical protein